MPIKPPTESKPKKLTWTQVKKHIESFSQASLLDLVHQLYEASDNNKAFLTTRFQPEATFGSHELEIMKKRIHRMMCPGVHSANGYPQLREARKIITDYKKTKDHLGTLDLMLTYVEAGNEFTCLYGDIDEPFYNSIESMLDSFAKLFREDSRQYGAYFAERLKQVARDASGIGWGYGDFVNDTINELDIWEKKRPKRD
jgi:hypothetical protein